VHVYVLQVWIELPILFFLERLIEGRSTNILIRIIMDAFTHNGNVAKRKLQANSSHLVLMMSPMF
jgi:hypothetical protein